MSAQILFIAHMPNAGMVSNDPDAWSRWLGFERACKSIAGTHTAMTFLSKNVFSHPAAGADEWLAQLVAAIQASKFSHSTYLIPSEITSLSK
jgi:hypothetical protein